MAIGSAAKGLKPRDDAVVFGEVGLSGEVRHVRYIEKRVAEANKLGFDKIIGPKTKKPSPGYHEATDVRTALNTYLGKE
jgi:DNA repair protein RadA/Sms